MFETVRDAALRVRRRAPAPNAPTVAFVHALGAGLWAWEGVAERLPPEWGLLLYDLRGHGLSGGMGETMGAHAADLLALAPEGAVACGLSIGGQVAMRAALDAPGRFRGLVLADTAPRIGRPEYYGARAARIRREGMGPFAEGQVRRWFAPAFARARPEVVEGARRALAAQPADGYVAACAAIGACDLTPELPGLTLPCLCLGGGEDVSTGPDAIAALATALPRAGYEILPGLGHMPPVEDPGVVAALVERFVRAAHPRA